MEKINELSKGTLKSYVNKAYDDAEHHSRKIDAHYHAAAYSEKGSQQEKIHKNKEKKHTEKFNRRDIGIDRAQRRLQETEELEEENLDRFFYTVDGSDKGMYVDAASRTEAIQKVEAKTGKKPVTIKLATDDKPMNENINQFIVSALSDNGSEVKSRIHSELSERITAALDTRKQEIAQSLFVPVQEEVEQIDELSGQTVSNYSKVAAHDKKKQEKDAAYHRGEQEKHEKSHGPMSKELASSHAKHAERSERSASNREMGLVKANKRLNPVKDTEETVNEEDSISSMHRLSDNEHKKLKDKLRKDHPDHKLSSAGVDKNRTIHYQIRKGEEYSRHTLSDKGDRKIQRYFSEESINELSKNTLKSYVKKAVNRVDRHSYLQGKDADKIQNKDVMKKYATNGKLVQKKKVGIERATERLSK